MNLVNDLVGGSGAINAFHRPITIVQQHVKVNAFKGVRPFVVKHFLFVCSSSSGSSSTIEIEKPFISMNKRVKIHVQLSVKFLSINNIHLNLRIFPLPSLGIYREREKKNAA